jgi:hypothetical protein
MRAYLVGLIAATLALIALVAVSSLGPDRYAANCPAPSARSVEGLFAPCLERQAMNDERPAMNSR